jgi:hypothetical protein
MRDYPSFSSTADRETDPRSKKWKGRAPMPAPLSPASDYLSRHPTPWRFDETAWAIFAADGTIVEYLGPGDEGMWRLILAKVNA